MHQATLRHRLATAIAVALVTSAPSAAQESSAAKSSAAENAQAPPAEKAKRFTEALNVLATSTQSARIVSALGTLREGFPHSRSALHQAMAGKSKRLHVFALRVLGEKGDAKHELPVVTKALRAPQVEVRRAAILALRQLGPDGFDELTRSLRSERDRNNLKLAIKTLQHWRKKEAIPHLIDLLKRNRKQSVRRFAFTALEIIGRDKRERTVEAWEEYWDAQEMQSQARKLVPHE